MKKWPESHWYMDTYYLIRNWVRNVESGREAGRSLGSERYLEVRYEDLVQLPNQVIEQVCAFLHEKPHPRMFEHTRLAAKVGPGPQDHTEVLHPISAASVQRWKDQMSPFDQKMSNRLAGRTLTSLGYALAERGSFSASERLGFLLVAGKFWMIDTFRSALYATGILTLNRDMRR
jgi:hypothetical protein